MIISRTLRTPKSHCEQHPGLLNPNIILMPSSAHLNSNIHSETCYLDLYYHEFPQKCHHLGNYWKSLFSGVGSMRLQDEFIKHQSLREFDLNVNSTPYSLCVPGKTTSIPSLFLHGGNMEK